MTVYSQFLFFPGAQTVPPDPSPSPSCPPPPVAPPTNAADVMVNFDPDPADLALSSVPGQEAFDPRRHRFSDEELKPQPMIKKARKMLVPDEQKVLLCISFQEFSKLPTGFMVYCIFSLIAEVL